MKIQHLCKSFDGKMVLDHVSLTLESGGTACLMAPSGRGKTTLLRCIAGLETPDSGQITDLPERIAYVFQEDRLCDGFSAVDNIRLVTGKALGEGEIRRHLEELGLEDGKRLIANTSGTYFWAPDRETELDCEHFANLAEEALSCADRGQAIALGQDAAEAYTADFLPDCQDEPWFREQAEKYRTLYRRLCTTVTRWLIEDGRYAEADSLCADAAERAPLDQVLVTLWMQALRLNGMPERALARCEELCAALSAAGQSPAAELEMEKVAAQQAIRGLPSDSTRLLHSLIKEEDDRRAMICDSGVFQEFVRRQLRELRRGGEAQLLSFRMAADAGHAKVRGDSMAHMENILLTSLRGADPVTRGGVDLFLVLLPGASRENGKAVAERVLHRYEQELPVGCEKFVYQVMDLNGEEAK